MRLVRAISSDVIDYQRSMVILLPEWVITTIGRLASCLTTGFEFDSDTEIKYLADISFGWPLCNHMRANHNSTDTIALNSRCNLCHE